ncbi:MAG TPA: HEPN domain-containing protein [Kofleriaceae bacterium]|nr:HEPN domain-containing protein [Kofleriaceae bacterium]
MAAGYLAAVADDLDAALRLAAPPANRLAAYHLQQAAEKLVKAILVHRKIHPGIEHRSTCWCACSIQRIRGSRCSTLSIGSRRMRRRTGIQVRQVA